MHEDPWTEDIAQANGQATWGDMVTVRQTADPRAPFSISAVWADPVADALHSEAQLLEAVWDEVDVWPPISVYKRVWYWVLRNMDPRDWYHAALCFIQRGRRGWSDCDWYGLDGYVAGIIAGAAERMRSGWAYPGREGAATPEEWSDVLRRIALGMRLVADDNWDAPMAQAKVNEALDLLRVWFLDLWD